MTRWMHPPELARSRDHDEFDPVAEGNRHRLDRETSLAIWNRACAQSERAGQRGGEPARRRFHEIAAAVAARGGRLRHDVGRMTRVELEARDRPADAWSSPVVEPTSPGRRTLVDAESQLDARATPLDRDVAARMSRLFEFDVSRVAVVPESPAITGSTKAVTQGDEVHFRSGAYQPGTPAGDWLIAHELAHVVQQQGGRGERAGTRKELEREADRAATLVARGRPAPIALRAERSAAYAFDDGEGHEAEIDDSHLDSRDEEAEKAGGNGAGSPAEVTHGSGDGSQEVAPHQDPPAADGHRDEEPEDGDAALADSDASAPIPAEDSPGGAPAVGAGPAAKPPKEVPSVAAAKPEAGLAQMHGVRPDKLGLLFGQVHTAASADVAQERAKQQANPPRQMSTGGPSGSGAAKGGAAAAGPANGRGAKRDIAMGAPDPKTAGAANAPGAASHDLPDPPVKAEVPGGDSDKQAKQGKAADQQRSAPQVIASVARSIASWFGSWSGHDDHGGDAGAPKVSDVETRQMSASIDQLPTTAHGITADTGPAPAIAMQGEAKTGAEKDRARLEATSARLETQGRADSRAPMGEDRIEPASAPEELTAAALPGEAAPAGPSLPTVAGAAPSEEIGIVAQEQHGAEIDAALSRASSDATAERGKHAREQEKARTESDAHLRELKTKADADQSTARAAARADVEQARGQWQAEIDKKGSEARKQADKKVAAGMAQVEAEEAKANAEARRHIDEGQRKAEDEKQRGEKAAADAKERGKEKSSGFFGWLASKAKAAFDGIKKAVSAAIDACKKAVKAVIDAAKKLAMAAIELARKVITAAIKAVGQALIAISNVLLAAFPGLKAKFQGLIKKAVDRAVAQVNKLADGLKQAVQKALDLLGAALDKALQLLDKGLSAIIDAASAVVQGAIKAAQAAVEVLGTWVKLIKDIASAPGAWLGKLGAAVMDGIKNHLWSAFKTTVVEWFKGKVFELLGVGGIILELLLEGGLTRDNITQMALDALMVAIPAALVAILIEKLVAMIIPAAGAVMAVIEGLQAAWGTISRIIAAFSAFMAFLLAVKGGVAGALFAGVLAAAAVVVLDFVANWLLKKLASAAKKVGAKLKGMAEKFKAKRKAKKDAKAKKHKDHDGPDAKKHKDDPDKAKKQEKEKQDRLDKAVAAIQPQVRKMLQKGVSRLVLQARLAMWRLRYRLSKLTIESGGSIVAVVNPRAIVDTANPAEVGRALLPILERVEKQVMSANRRKRPSGQSDAELDSIDAIRAYRKGHTNVKPGGLVIFNRNNLAQYFRPGDSSYVNMEAAGRLPSSALLTLERARGPGNVVGMDVADQMRAQGVPGAEDLTQNRNMMAGLGAAKAADQKHFVEQGYPGKLTSSTDPAAVAQAQQKVDDGDLARMTALGEIFMALRSALEAKDASLLADPTSPLTQLAQAFDSWLEANLPKDDGKVSARDLRLARMVLITKLRAFMSSRRGV